MSKAGSISPPEFCLKSSKSPLLDFEQRIVLFLGQG